MLHTLPPLSMLFTFFCLFLLLISCFTHISCSIILYFTPSCVLSATWWLTPSLTLHASTCWPTPWSKLAIPNVHCQIEGRVTSTLQADSLSDLGSLTGPTCLPWYVLWRAPHNWFSLLGWPDSRTFFLLFLKEEFSICKRKKKRLNMFFTLELWARSHFVS